MIRVRPMERDDRPWLVRRLKDAFGDVELTRKGILVDASTLPGFIAVDEGQPVGFLTYEASEGECEVVGIGSTEEDWGIGRASMEAVQDHAAAAGCHRLRLITTNNNTRAFRFYQIWGLDLCAFHRHGVRRSRKVKPSISDRGTDGIPLDHELEFELHL